MSGKDTGPPTRSPYSGSASFLHSTPGGGEIHDLMQRSLRIKNTLFLFRTGIAMGRETKTGYKNEKLDINDVFTVDKTESRKEESIFKLVVGCLYTKKCVLSVEVGLSTRRK